MEDVDENNVGENKEESQTPFRCARIHRFRKSGPAGIYRFLLGQRPRRGIDIQPDGVTGAWFP